MSSYYNIIFCEWHNLHPSFRIYKYYWWIFAKNSAFHSAAEVFYNAKTLYSVIRDEYNVGFVKPCGFDMIMTTFDLNVDSKSLYIIKHKKIDLSSFEKREELQSVLRERKKFFEKCLLEMKNYMILKYSLEDLF